MIEKMNDLELTALKLEREAAGAIGQNAFVVRDADGNVVNVKHIANNEWFKNCVINVGD